MLTTGQRPPNFLLVDDVDENRFLISKTLLRHFPGATLTECDEAATAQRAARELSPTLLIVHRAHDLDGVSLIRALREDGVTVPIIMVSGRESCPEAIEAGATVFLNYEAWLRIGTVAKEVLSPEFVKPFTATPFRTEGDFLGMRPAAQRPA